MNESESSGTAKGSLKDRLRVLAILMKIAKKKKLKIKFLSINSKKVFNINRMYYFFYKPVRETLSNEVIANDIITYNKIQEKGSVVRNMQTMHGAEISIIRRFRHKKGIGEIKDIEEQKKKDIALENKKEEEQKIKEEISKKYNVSPESISEALIHDYSTIKNSSQELFDIEIDESTKEALIIDRIKAEKDLEAIKKITGDVFFERDVDYDLKLDNKALEKLNKVLEEQKKEIDRISRQIDRYNIVTETKTKYKNVGSLFSGVIGIGFGLLTLPFSFSRTIALGTNLINKSTRKINEKFKSETTVTKVKNYRITAKDIDSVEKSLKSADFLMSETLDELDRLKYKLKNYGYKIPNASEKLKEIEALEKGFAKKKESLTKVVESLEKSKVKVLNREKEGKK